ncbi:MAG: hypothetical protein ACI9OJ_000949 [Myxococcota bacterium]|jgi:hypothetical protein
MNSPMTISTATALVALSTIAFAPLAVADKTCQGYGPQTPRDISKTEGANERMFTLAPDSTKMNLCNIHTHTNAEHKGPGFSVFAGSGDSGGFQCNETNQLTKAQLKAPKSKAFKGVKPGGTIEVHWVHTSCDVKPGVGLGSCLSKACANPQLRVEAQVFLLVNDKSALNFADFAHAGHSANGYSQPKALPSGTGTPVVFAGSTTGPQYTEEVCSPLQVTWSVRPQCAMLDINSLHAWAQRGNVFEESKSHGVRQLVTNPALLSPIK